MVSHHSAQGLILGIRVRIGVGSYLCGLVTHSLSQKCVCDFVFVVDHFAHPLFVGVSK